MDCGDDCPVILDAAWTVDGTRLAYAVGCAGNCRIADETLGIWVFDVRTGENGLLLPGTGVGDAADRVPLAADVAALDLSPDGTRLAYDKRGCGIVLMGVDTLSATALPGRGTPIRCRGRRTGGSSPTRRAAQTCSSRPRRLPGRLPREGIPTRLVPGRNAARVSARVPTLGHHRGRRGPLTPGLVPEGDVGSRQQAQLRSACEDHPDARPVWSPDGTQLAAVFANRVYLVDAGEGTFGSSRIPSSEAWAGSVQASSGGRFRWPARKGRGGRRVGAIR
jgi:hypothetical protein